MTSYRYRAIDTSAPSALSSFLAWTGLTLFAVTVCVLMGGLWMVMLGVEF